MNELSLCNGNEIPKRANEWLQKHLTSCSDLRELYSHVGYCVWRSCSCLVSVQVVRGRQRPSASLTSHWYRHELRLIHPIGPLWASIHQVLSCGGGSIWKDHLLFTYRNRKVWREYSSTQYVFPASIVFYCGLGDQFHHCFLNQFI